MRRWCARGVLAVSLGQKLRRRDAHGNVHAHHGFDAHIDRLHHLGRHEQQTAPDRDGGRWHDDDMVLLALDTKPLRRNQEGQDTNAALAAEKAEDRAHAFQIGFLLPVHKTDELF